MSTTEPTTIDEKKTEDSGTTNKKADWKAFSKNFSNGLITGIFLGVVVIGSAGLFLAKVSNANILPTDCDIEPYPSATDKTVNQRVVPREIIHMNPVKILDFYGLNFFSSPISNYIQEANFVNEDAGLNFMNEFKNSWLCSLKDKAYPSSSKIVVGNIIDPSSTSSSLNNEVPLTDVPATNKITGIYKPNLAKLPKNSPFLAYEFEILKKMTCTSFSFLNTIFFYMNYLPEWGAMIFFGLFFSVIIPLIWGLNFIYGLWPHFSNFGKMLYYLYHPNEFNTGLTDMEETHDDWWSTIWFNTKNIFYVIFYFIGAGFSAMIAPTIVTGYALFKALSAEYVVRDTKFTGSEKESPRQNLFSFIKSTLYYKRTFLIILIILNLMATTNEYLGTSYLSGAIIAILILIFGFKILENDIPEGLNKIVNIIPPLSQPEVDLTIVTPPVDMCDITPKIRQVVSKETPDITATGFKGSNVLISIPDASLTQSGGGGRLVKTKLNPKPKTKIYNLKLV
jgi:hypothetical protein